MIQPPLLEWFRKNKRSLPWRKTRDPYAIWISEIMLQQTQVKTVIPYYERWMKQFPDVRKLSRAPLSRVLKLWEGLGYYSRARNLHRTARMIDKKWGGKFSDSRENLESLPGIGRYTAAAIASIAFNQPEPILDGNVMRVLSRVFAVKEPVDNATGKEKLWNIANTLHTPSLRGGEADEAISKTGLLRPFGARNDVLLSTLKFSPGDFNQSLMELGALVCLPENPKCSVCPIEKHCLAHRLKKEVDFPLKARRQRLEKLHTVAAVIWKNGKVLLERQPLRARWGGLWMFPQWIHRNGKSEAAFLEEKVRLELGIHIKNWHPRTEIRHSFTKYNVRLRVYEGRVLSVIARRPSGRRSNLRSEIASTAFGDLAMTCWMTPDQLFRLPLPSPHQKIAREIQSHA